jgi:ASC-1-like (ASCH) protein
MSAITKTELKKSEPVRIMNPSMRENNLSTTRSRFSIELEHKKIALILKNEKRLPQFCRQLPLKMQYLEAILNGSKNVEGRINSGIPRLIKEKDHLLFFSGETCCLTKIVQKKSYTTFREMLEDCGVLNCLPGFNGGLDAAERLYRSFPGYAEKEKQHGVLGFVLEVVSNEELKKLQHAHPHQGRHESRPQESRTVPYEDRGYQRKEVNKRSRDSDEAREYSDSYRPTYERERKRSSTEYYGPSEERLRDNDRVDDDSSYRKRSRLDLPLDQQR